MKIRIIKFFTVNLNKFCVRNIKAHRLATIFEDKSGNSLSLREESCGHEVSFAFAGRTCFL